MAESPVAKLARLVGGVALLPGPLGHQVLGQLLITGSSSVEVAGATVALAAASRQPSAAAQIALRTVVPAVVLEALINKEEQRLARKSAEIERERRELMARTEAARCERERLDAARQRLEEPMPLDERLSQEILDLRNRNTVLERELESLRRRLAEMGSGQTGVGVPPGVGIEGGDAGTAQVPGEPAAEPSTGSEQTNLTPARPAARGVGQSPGRKRTGTRMKTRPGGKPGGTST